jgi:hypothetical protein
LCDSQRQRIKNLKEKPCGDDDEGRIYKQTTNLQTPFGLGFKQEKVHREKKLYLFIFNILLATLQILKVKKFLFDLYAITSLFYYYYLSLNV